MTPVRRPPRHLSAEARDLWASVVETYVLEARHVAILTKSLEAFDRANQARDAIAAGGLTVETRFGEVRVSPFVAIERDARAAFLAGQKALGLDLEEPTKPRGRM